MIEVLRLDSSTVSLSALQSALYRMSEHHGLACRLADGDFVVNAISEMNKEEVKSLLQHVNDYVLRERLEAETGKIRDAILGAALSKVIRENEVG